MTHVLLILIHVHTNNRITVPPMCIVSDILIYAKPAVMYIYSNEIFSKINLFPNVRRDIKNLYTTINPFISGSNHQRQHMCGSVSTMFCTRRSVGS